MSSTDTNSPSIDAAVAAAAEKKPAATIDDQPIEPDAPEQQVDVEMHDGNQDQDA